MASSRSQKPLCQVTDCFGHLWNVTASLPTQHGWNVLRGFPVINGKQWKGMGPARTILTPELRAYLEEFRMKKGKMQLPVSFATICKLRRQLGMNYWHDCKQWWHETKNTEMLAPAMVQNDAPLKPKNLTWMRDEILQTRELLDSDMSPLEIANIMGKKEKAIFKLRKRLLGLRVHRWTTQEEEKFTEAIAANVPLETIAKDLGRSLSSIKGKLAIVRKEQRDRLVSAHEDFQESAE